MTSENEGEKRGSGFHPNHVLLSHPHSVSPLGWSCRRWRLYVFNQAANYWLRSGNFLICVSSWKQKPTENQSCLRCTQRLCGVTYVPHTLHGKCLSHLLTHVVPLVLSNKGCTARHPFSSDAWLLPRDVSNHTKSMTPIRCYNWWLATRGNLKDLLKAHYWSSRKGPTPVRMVIHGRSCWIHLSFKAQGSSQVSFLLGYKVIIWSSKPDQYYITLNLKQFCSGRRVTVHFTAFKIQRV